MPRRGAMDCEGSKVGELRTTEAHSKASGLKQKEDDEQPGAGREESTLATFTQNHWRILCDKRVI